MPAETGFGLGFFCGVLLGAVGVYLAVTPEGKALRKTAAEDFKKHQQTFILESIIPDREDRPPTESSFAKTVHALILKAKKYVKEPTKASTSKIIAKPASTKKKHIFKKSK